MWGKGQRPAASLAKKVVVSTVAQVASQIITSVLAVVTLKIITTSLGVADYGLYATIYAFVSTFSLLTDLGLNAITAREIAKEPARADDIIGHNMGLRIVLCVVMIPLIALLSFVFYPHQSNSLHVGIVLMALYLLFDAVRSVALAYFTSKVRNDVVALIVTVQQIVLTLAVVLVAVQGGTLYGFIGAFVAANAAGAVMAVYVTRKAVKLRPQISIRRWKTILAMSVSLGIIQVINMLYLKADSIMLSILKDTTAVGVYGVAYSLILAFLALPSFIMSALIPSLATASRERAEHIVGKAFQYMAILACLLAAGGFTVRHDLVTLVANKSFAASATPFAILALASAFTYLNSVFGFASVSLNKHHRLVYLSVGSLACNILLNLYCIPHYGVAGAAWATVASELTALVGAYSIFRQQTGLHIRVFVPLLRPAFTALVTLFVVHVCEPALVRFGSLVHLAAIAALTTLVYGATLWVVRGIPAEVREAARRTIRLRS